MSHSDWAWIALAAAVLGYEIIAPPGQLLSHAAARYRRAHPILTDVTIAYFALHLAQRWPARIDPLHRIAERLGK